MRYLSYLSLLFFAFSGLFFSSCDTVENPFPRKRSQSFIDTLSLDSVEASRNFGTPIQKVLLEDYTGHQCGNCPAAASQAKDLKKTYGEKLVVMAVHVGWFARTNPTGKYSYDFTTDAGDDFNTRFKVDDFGLPQGMVNRITPAGKSSPVVTRANWNTLISSRVNQNPKISLKVSNFYKAKSRVINTKVTTQALENLPGNYNIGVYLLEDSIVNWQKDYTLTPPDDNIEKYVHQHVLRSSLNGSWGEPLKAGPLTSGETFTNYYGLELDPSWKAEDCTIVVFIYNTDTNELIQAEEAHIRL